MPPAQTIKQAKASFSARGRPSLTAKEQRQLARSLELEQRAERAKEQAKRKAAAAKKRAENEVKGRSVEERDARLGTQRRKDRFGHVSSQFHLGAFLRRERVKGDLEMVMDEGYGGAGKDKETEKEDDYFGDDDLDDEVMMNALDAPCNEHVKSDSVVQMSPPPRPLIQRSPFAPLMEDMGDFWDDLESSTQIARELGGTEAKSEFELEMSGKSTSTRSASFGSLDFDLTAEDLDQLDPPRVPVLEARLSEKKESMPPPPTRQMAHPHLPVKAAMSPLAISTKEIGGTASNPRHSRGSNGNVHITQSRETKNTTQRPPLRDMNTTIIPPQPTGHPIAKASHIQRSSITMQQQPALKPGTPRPLPPPPAKHPPPTRKPLRKSVSFNLTDSSSTPPHNSLPQKGGPQTMSPSALRKLHNSPSPQQQKHLTKPRNAIKGPYISLKGFFCAACARAQLIRSDADCVKQKTIGPFLPASSLYCSPDLGFTLTQLEGFVDEDLQLTQQQQQQQQVATSVVG